MAMTEAGMIRVWFAYGGRMALRMTVRTGGAAAPAGALGPDSSADICEQMKGAGL